METRGRRLRWRGSRPSFLQRRLLKTTATKTPLSMAPMARYTINTPPTHPSLVVPPAPEAPSLTVAATQKEKAQQSLCVWDEDGDISNFSTGRTTD